MQDHFYFNHKAIYTEGSLKLSLSAEYGTMVINKQKPAVLTVEIIYKKNNFRVRNDNIFIRKITDFIP